MTERAKVRAPHLPVDTFLRALAHDQQGGAIGVILSGSGADGSQGITEIKGMGGITFAQELQTAQYNSMPYSAIETGCVDFVLPPAQIALELARIGNHPYLAPAAETEPVADEFEESFRKVLAIMRSSSGVDFGLYRNTTIRRRILRRMVLNNRESLRDYIHLLESDAEKPRLCTAIY